MNRLKPHLSQLARLGVPLSLAAFAGLLAVAGAAPPPAALTPPAPDEAAFAGGAKPLLDRYCVTCHGGAKPAGGLSLAGRSAASIGHEAGLPDKISRALRTDRMPPPGSTPLAADHRAALIAFAERLLAPVTSRPNPGRVAMHRLNRYEYNNTIRDLLGLDTRPADAFPADGGGGGGFDNNADTLFTPPILMERYVETAGDASAAVPTARLFAPLGALPRKGGASLRTLVARWLTKAYRRPAEPVEIDRLTALGTRAMHRGQSFEAAARLALKAALVSPNFLFRIEPDPAGQAPRPLTGYELASRLSYFLWASMPDDALFARAASGRLRDPAVLSAEVERMVKDPKSRALSESFARQWLHTGDLRTTIQPDHNRFPDFSPALRDAMMQEPEAIFADAVREDHSLLSLLDSPYTYVNEALATHYGLTGVKGPEMRRVALPDRRRGGLITTGAVLTLTSYPERTSPVLRGKWVLSEILGTPPPPPPPGAGGLSPDDAPHDGMSFRQRLEKHRSKPQCASCHARMDPIGFGLENFDPVGRWRDKIGGAPVDASGVLVNGNKFTGPVELKQQLLAQKDTFLRNITEKLLAYALGRGIEPYDSPAVDRIIAALGKSGASTRTLIRQIAASYPFQYRNPRSGEPNGNQTARN